MLYQQPADPAHFREYYVNSHLPLVRKMPHVMSFGYSFEVAGDSPYFAIFEAEFADAEGRVVRDREFQVNRAERRFESFGRFGGGKRRESYYSGCGHGGSARAGHRSGCAKLRNHGAHVIGNSCRVSAHYNFCRRCISVAQTDATNPRAVEKVWGSAGGP